MPDNTLPLPSQVLGKKTALPKPNEVLNVSPIGRLNEGDANTVLPTYTTPQDIAVDSSIALLKEKGGRNGTTVTDSEWDVLKDVLKDTRATKEQREKAILTIQGYDPKHDDNNTMYYNKLEDNGVYVPTALAYGEKPPKGYKVASVWGNQKEANDDSWYTDLGKSLANGVLGATQGVVDLAQVGQTLVTGEESDYLNKLGNTAEALKFKKDEDLNKPIYNTEGIQSFGDLVDKNRFDLSPQALWGSFNMAAESLTEFGLGAKGAGALIKNSPKAQIFTGSFMSQLGDNLDNAEEAGLKGRDKSAVASLITAPMAALDAFWGLDGKIMSNVFQNEKRKLVKDLIKEVEKDELGNITQQGFKELAKKTTVAYGELAKSGVREAVADIAIEGGQEAAQDFSQKAGEQLWDKLSPEDKGKYGSDALSAKSFGDYINSFAMGLVGGAPMTVANQVIKSKNEEQSINAYERVKQGPQAVQALKADLAANVKSGDITPEEQERALFKIDKYQQYHELTKKYDFKPEDEKRAFELSFQIDGLKEEIPTNENEISKLGPIERGEVEGLQTQQKKLQKELNELILKGQVKKEPTVAKEIETKTEKETTTPKTESVLPELEKIAKEKKPKVVYEEHVELKNKPKYTEDKRSYEEIPTEEFNNHYFNARTAHRTLRKELGKRDNKEMIGRLGVHEYSYSKDGKPINNRTIQVNLEDGRTVKLASSMIRVGQGELSGYVHTERFKGEVPNTPVGVKVIDLNNPEGKLNEGEYKPGKKVIKVYQKSDGKFLSWVKETNIGAKNAKDKNGNALYSPEEIDLLETLKLQDETPSSEEMVEAIKNTPFVPVKPTIKQRAEKATEKIVAEAKESVKKASVPLTITKQGRQQLYDLGYSKANVDNMKPERANEIINKQQTQLSEEKQVKENKKDGKEENTVNGKESANRGSGEAGKEREDSSKATKLKTSKNRIQRKVKEPNRLKASKIIVDNAYDLVMQHFIGGGYIDRDSLKSFFKGKESEAFARQNLTLKLDKYNPRFAPNMKDLAHSLWEEHQDSYPKFNTEDYLNALEEVLLENSSPIQMAKDLIKKTEAEPLNRQEELLAGIYEDKEVDPAIADGIIESLEAKTDEELKALANKDVWEEGTDIIINNENEPFQKKKTEDIDLDQVKQQAKNILNGKETYKRFSEEEQDGLKRGGEANVEASIITGRQVEANENQDDRVERQEAELEAYAKENGIWYDNTEEHLEEKHGEPLGSGQESFVYDNGKTVVKTSVTNQYVDLQDFFDGVTIHNTYFPESTRKVIGFGRDSEGEFNVITEQQFIEGTHEVEQSLIDDYMKSKGFTKGASAGRFKNNDVLTNDVTPKNVILTPEGNIIPFDTIPHLNSVAQPMNESGTRGRVYGFDKVVAAIQKSFPKVKVIVDAKFNDNSIAGKVGKDGNIYVNPNYAGLDTPIHEAGHILIDVIGYNNKVIQQAVKQLYGTDLYNEIADRYPELDTKELLKETLAEAIGREGAKIFESEADKSKFKKYLEYIFDWFKTKLGIDKNVAKTLAKQVLSGIGTKNITATKKETEEFQKPKTQGLRPLSFEQYLADKAINVDKEQEKIDEAKIRLEIAQEEESDALASGTEEEHELAVKELKEAKKNFAKVGKNIFEYKQYKKDFKVVQEMLKVKDLTNYSLDELQDVYNQIKGFESKAVQSLKKEVMLRIASELHRQGRERIMSEHKDYIEDVAKKKDIGKAQVWLMSGSHFTEHQPEMQEAYKVIQEAQLNKIKESNEKKAVNEALARKVIAEENKKLGISAKGAVDRFSSDSAKYFEWMDNGNGGLITMDEAKEKGYSKARLDYLDFTRKILAERNDEMSKDNYQNADQSVIKVDKHFGESFKQDGLAQAFSYYLGGGGSNLGNVRIMYKGQPTEFKNIEKDIISKTKKGDVIGNIKALFELLYYNFSARKQLSRGFNVDEAQNPLEIKGDAEFSLNGNGELVSKFDRPRTKDRGYSKDFYRAMIEYIDETAHVKHINPVLPIIDSVELLNKEGYSEEGIGLKPHVAQWVKEFKALHIYKEKFVNDPTLDATIKFFRKLTAASTMWFNIPAGVINTFMGNYNSWRQENAATILKGNKRLFIDNKEGREKGVNKYALDIIRKYNVVNQDYDSNPKIGLGKIFDSLATLMTRAGEFQIQGGLALGLMSDKVYDSFEYKNDEYGNPQLVLKEGADEKAINDEMVKVKNRVTDIQGKYPDEDRRNIMRGEIAKAAFQFKIWMLDYFKERFSAKYINANNEVREGTFNKLVNEGFKQLKNDLKSGNIKGLLKNDSFMSNMKGLIAIGLVLTWVNSDDDDENKRKKASLAENTLGQLLFILDPDQLKYTLANPVAALGKMKDMVSAIEALFKLEDGAFDKIERVIPARKLLKIVE
jgi:hypothetical protein